MKYLKQIMIVALAMFVSASSCKKSPLDDPQSEPEPEVPVTPAKPQRSECELTIMSFNVAVDNRQAQKGWADRKKAVLNMLEQVRPLVIGFQEAQAHEITDMVDARPEYSWYGIGRDTGKVPPHTTDYSAEESMAVFWLADSLQVIDKGTFWLSQTPGQLGLGWDAAYSRTLTWVEFMHKETKQKFFMFNTHLDNKGKTARTESMKLIASKMEELNPDGYPAFLTADFNTVSSDAIFAPIKPKMRSARDYAPETDRAKFTYNGYTAAGKSQIDHIFYCGEGLSPLKFKVLDGDYGNPWISDHFPILGTFKYKKQL